MFALQIECNANFVLCTLFSFSQILSLLFSAYSSTFFVFHWTTLRSLLTWIIHEFVVFFVVVADGIATWMIICLQRYPVNWQNRQIYRNCKLREIVFRHIFMFFSSISGTCTYPLHYSVLIYMRFHLRFLSGNRINTILKDDLPKNLITLELRGNPLGDIKFDALQSMPRLRKL